MKPFPNCNKYLTKNWGYTVQKSRAIKNWPAAVLFLLTLCSTSCWWMTICLPTKHIQVLYYILHKLKGFLNFHLNLTNKILFTNHSLLPWEWAQSQHTQVYKTHSAAQNGFICDLPFVFNSSLAGLCWQEIETKCCSEVYSRRFGIVGYMWLSGRFLVNVVLVNLGLARE